MKNLQAVQAEFSMMRWLTNRRALLSMLIVGGALTMVGCGSSEADCEDGWHRKFACGENLDGLQPQQCVDGKWESINFCALPDGTKHPDSDKYPFDPDIGKDKPGNGDPGNGDPGNNNPNPPGPGKDDPNVTRPTSPEGCIELENEDVNGGKTLTGEDCYVVNKRLTVTEGTLTIEPGVTLLFKKDVHLVIEGAGRLNAMGESGKAVWFEGTQKEAGFWGGIIFDKTGGGDNKLEHVVVRHAGGKNYTGNQTTRGGILLNGGTIKLSVSDSVIEQNAFAGINGLSENSNVKIQSSLFKKNEVPLRLLANHLIDLGDDLVFTDNADANEEDSNYVLVHAGSTANKKGNWPAYTYRSNGNIHVSDSIKIAPGATIEMTKGTHIQVQGDNAGLNAVGTADKPITFSSVAKRRGSWRGIDFNDSNSPDNVFEHVIIEYGGDSPYTGNQLVRGALHIGKDKVDLALDHITFRENEFAALRIDATTAKFTMDNAAFVKNEVSIRTTPNYVGEFAENLTFEENDKEAILISGGSLSKEAKWNTYSVPYEIVTGSGNGTLTVQEALTLSPKSVLMFPSKGGLSVSGSNGSLNAVSETAGERIVLRGTDDVKGAWRGVQFLTRKSANQLKGVDILNGGDSGWTGNAFTVAGLYATNNARVVLSDTTIKGSGKYGVSTYGNAELVGCEGLTVTDNQGDDFYGMTGVADCVSE